MITEMKLKHLKYSLEYLEDVNPPKYFLGIKIGWMIDRVEKYAVLYKFLVEKPSKGRYF